MFFHEKTLTELVEKKSVTIGIFTDTLLLYTSTYIYTYLY